MHRVTYFMLLFLLPNLLSSQSNVLDDYVQLALDNNIALRQKNLSYEKSLASLKEAKALFFPVVSLEARYSVARGGRAIDLPLGDLMNPVYTNLNLINESAGNSFPEFPQIENQQINFLRETEHETKLRLQVPIYNSAILNNHRIRQNLTEADRVSVAIYKRELRKEVKMAYYNFLKASEAVRLFENTKLLVDENLRTTKSLNKYDKVTIDVVYAAEVEVKRVEQQLAEAEKNQKVTQAFFNFLLNRDYETSIDVDANSLEPVLVAALDDAQSIAGQSRQELQQLNYFLAASEQGIELNKGGFLPQISLVADYGFQGTKYAFGSDDDFLMGSLVMSWKFFDKSTKLKVEQADLEKQILQERKNETKQQIGLQVINTYYALNAAIKQIELAKSEVASAEKAYKLVAKKFRQGQANLVELTNARTQLTNAEQQQNITKYDYQIKLAEYENAVGR